MSKLVDAVMRCDYEGVRNALAQGADVNEADGNMTPLLSAIMTGHVETVRILLEHGADPNFRPTSISDWPLWSAEDDFGFPEMAQLLKAHGARKAE